jgi:thymidylate synthase (FAD)
MGSDLSVVNAARVSFHKTSEWEPVRTVEFGMAQLKPEGVMFNYEHGEIRLSAKDQKLIAYLAKHNHWTPFAHAFLSFRIKAPIFVARQLVKHQVGLAWNEVSRRYVDDEPEFYFPDVWRGKPVNAKQGSDGEVDDPTIRDDVEALLSEVALLYGGLLNIGVAPEQARMVLPQNTMTEWIWSGSLAAFARVCKLRLDPHAQAETREVAQLINDLVPKEFEHSWNALLNKNEQLEDTPT